jgi:hypothetical protein|tara:strand:+ start:1838 stop:2137 length:300 start_codon:yes stop_codon:yes gene_type:complete
MIMSSIFVIYALIACNLVVFGASLYACARVAKFERSVQELDWEAIAALTGDMGVMKKSIQKLNNRLNGMESSDPMQVLSRLPQLQQNVTTMPQRKQTGG